MADKKPLKARAWATIRNASIGLVGLIGGNWLLVFLGERGWFSDTEGQVSAAQGYATWLVGQQWFVWLSGISIGFAAGAWIDYRMKLADIPAAIRKRFSRRVPHLDDLFRSDFGGSVGSLIKIEDQGEIKLSDGFRAQYIAAILVYLDLNAKLVSFYLHPTDRIEEVCAGLAEHMDYFLSQGGGVKAGGGGRQEMNSDDPKFCGRVFLYYEPTLSFASAAAIVSAFSTKGMLLQIRGLDWALGSHTGDGSIFIREPQRTVKLYETDLDGPD
jgi:hypothetical protein